MPDLVRIYHPETEEPFDLPVGKANELVLNKGWLQQKPDKSAKPYVTTTIPPAAPIIDDWREDEAAESDEEIYTGEDDPE